MLTTGVCDQNNERAAKPSRLDRMVDTVHEWLKMGRRRIGLAMLSPVTPSLISELVRTSPMLDGEPGRKDGKDTWDSEPERIIGPTWRDYENHFLKSLSKELVEVCEDETAHMVASQQKKDGILTRLYNFSPKNYSTNLIKMLFGDIVWADGYDPHMKATGHDNAIDNLLKQAYLLDALRDIENREPFIGEDILEMSCGTGTVIDLLCRNATPENRARIKVVANDLSDAMKDIARKKLWGQCDVKYTCQDVRKLKLPEASFDTAILSQTLHLITDPKKLNKEMSANSVRGFSDHVDAKIDAIRRAFASLKEGGHFMLIDEWPAVLTAKAVAKQKKENAVTTLFETTFRPIQERMDIRTDVMTSIPGARFVAELKAPIDRWHSMYLFIYEKRDENEEKRKLPPPEKDMGTSKQEVILNFISKAEVERQERIATIAKARENAEVRLLGSLMEIDSKFRAAYWPEDGEAPAESAGSADTVYKWRKFTPMLDLESTLRIDNPLKISELGSKEWTTIIISRQMHQMDESHREELIEGAINALTEGGALLIADEWDPPEGSSHPIVEKADLWKTMKKYQKKDVIMFEASMREPIMAEYQGSGMFGYLYRKINPFPQPQIED